MVTTDQFPTFLAEVQALGATDVERAQKLGVGHSKTVERLRKRLPKPLDVFVRQPDLLRALLADIERQAA